MAAKQGTSNVPLRVILTLRRPMLTERLALISPGTPALYCVVTRSTCDISQSWPKLHTVREEQLLDDVKRETERERERERTFNFF